MTLFQFLAILPAILSFIGFVFYLIWKNNKSSSPLLSEIIHIVKQNSKEFKIDNRLTPKQAFTLLNENPELRKRLHDNEYNLLNQIIKSESRRTFSFGILAFFIIALSIFGYYKVNQFENRLVISNVQINGMFEGNIYEMFTTNDDLILKWAYKGEGQEIFINATCIESNKTSNKIKCIAKDGFLRIPKEYLIDFWGCPTLENIFTLRINVQTNNEVQTFGPYKVKPSLTVLYYLDDEKNSIAVWTQTMNCGLLKYSYLFNIVAWEKHNPKIESLHIDVVNGKGEGKFPQKFKIDPNSIKTLYEGEYPDELVRIFKM